MVGFLLKLGVPRSDLDDLMQEVFLVAHRNGGYAPGPAKPTTYLANIAFKTTVSHRRKCKSRGAVHSNYDEITQATTERASPELAVEQRQRLHMLHRALSALDADKRAVFVLAELQGETVVAIAAKIGIPVDTAYSRLRAARKIFRRAVEVQEDALGEVAVPCYGDGRLRVSAGT